MTIKTQKKPKIFYGWIVVIFGMMTLGVGVGAIGNCSSLFIRPICEELGFSRQAMGINQTLISMVTMLIVLFSGSIYAKFRLSNLMKAGAVLLCAAYACYSFASNIYVFYCISALIAVGQAFTTYMPFSVIISNWFEKSRGLAIGLTFMGSGIGGMIFNVLAGRWISELGWRPAYLLLAGCVALVMLPSIFLIIKPHPLDLGLSPYGEESGNGGSPSSPALYGPTLHEALRTPRFAILSLAMFLVGIALNAIPCSMAPHLSDSAYSDVAAANAVAAMMGALAISKIGLGFLYDKLGLRFASALSGLALMIGFAGMIYAKIPAALALVILGAGFGCAFGSVAYPIISYSTFGTRGYSAITGVISAVGGFGNALSATICGTVFDHTGSYTPAYVALFFLTLITMGAVVAALPRKPLRAEG